VTPFPIDGTSSDVHYTYLDTTGRPVLVLTKKNVVSELDRYFQVTYNFSKLSMLYEPLLLIVAFFIFFLFVMVYVRIEFHIGPVSFLVEFCELDYFD
jgi:oligosaccharyltransferase complex subunit alpha (ribophorin I)